VKRYVQETVKRFGKKDIFLNNAGIMGAVKPIEAIIPLARYAQAEEVAHYVLFLSSDESRYITGATHAIAGGFHT
jgi:NAD(P)-dependent dehydrogenase (short-subunit alcohol dehydrogenase family)